MKYYHITRNNPLLIHFILQGGLQANKEGDIYLFEDVAFKFNGVSNFVADHIAENQIFLDEYAMFEVDSEGFTTELIPDNVGELCSKWQWILKQPKIKPKFIKLHSIQKTNYEKAIHNPTTSGRIHGPA